MTSAQVVVLQASNLSLSEFAYVRARTISSKLKEEGFAVDTPAVVICYTQNWSTYSAPADFQRIGTSSEKRGFNHALLALTESKADYLFVIESTWSTFIQPLRSIVNEYVRLSRTPAVHTLTSEPALSDRFARDIFFDRTRSSLWKLFDADKEAFATNLGNGTYQNSVMQREYLPVGAISPMSKATLSGVVR